MNEDYKKIADNFVKQVGEKYHNDSLASMLGNAFIDVLKRANELSLVSGIEVKVTF